MRAERSNPSWKMGDAVGVAVLRSSQYEIGRVMGVKEFSGVGTSPTRYPSGLFTGRLPKVKHPGPERIPEAVKSKTEGPGCAGSEFLELCWPVNLTFAVCRRANSSIQDDEYSSTLIGKAREPGVSPLSGFNGKVKLLFNL